MRILRRLTAICALIITGFTAYAQQTDTTRKPAVDTVAIPVDTVAKPALPPLPPIDTALLTRGRIDPKTNLLPVKFTPFEIRPVSIPVTALNLEVSYWRKYVQFGLNLNQSTFSGNWAAGGVNSIALGSTFNYKAEYKKDAKSFTTELALQYGKLKNKDQAPRKTQDRIFFDNKGAFQISKYWYFFGSVSFESQFDQGFQYRRLNTGRDTAVLISGFLAPGYFTESIGFEYKPKPYFSLRIGTGTARQTIVRGDTTQIFRTITNRYGLEPGKKFRNELAFQSVANFDKDIAKNMHLVARYLIFASYDNFRWDRIDHRLDATLSARVNRLINVSLTGTLYYDKDTDDKIQAFQGLNLGLMYKFPY
ncbi:MAG: DUF3078 domain-containing protein [Mucilaginibacter polytrichastri]|nr:DUF3078 domain-containing protein [Mucilaginibacter polytrichastri]